MRKRQVGNYLKEYPHVYEAFQKSIEMKGFAKGLLVVLMVLIAFSALALWVMGDKDGATFFIILLTVAVILLAFLVFGKKEMISEEELELMERDLAGEKEKIGDWGYSTKESFMIGLCRIPRQGLTTVYMGVEVRGGSGRGATVVRMNYYDWEFYYEDGTHRSAGLLKAPETSDEENFVSLIRKYDNNVKIYRYRKIKENAPLFCPFQRFRAEEPFVKKGVVEGLTNLGNGNPFWRLGAKSRDRYDGNKEVELILYGTALTWLLWLAWLCLSVYLFFYSAYLGLEAAAGLVFIGAGLCYYLVFIKSARKITEKAKTVFYKNRE